MFYHNNRDETNTAQEYEVDAHTAPTARKQSDEFWCLAPFLIFNWSSTSARELCFPLWGYIFPPHLALSSSG